MTLAEFRGHLAPRFSYMDSVIDTLYYAITTKSHVILHGPGGHAKSTVVEEALKLFVGEDRFYSDVFIANASEDMDISPVVGYDNIPKFQKEGVLEKVLTDTIFIKNRYAILEEGLDAPGMLITAMKDPLMRGSTCINGVCIKNKLESMFICTNVDPISWAGTDRSRLALLQRFTFSVEVSWPEYTVKTFEPFLKKRGIPNPIVAKFGEICHTEKYPISPRSIERMENLYSTFGIAALKTFENMPSGVYKKLGDYEKNVPFLRELYGLQAEFESLISSTKTPQERILGATNVAAKVKKIKGIPMDGGFSGMVRQLLLDCSALITTSNDEL